MVDTNFYITRMQVYNLFGKENIDWELRQDVNILGGINGSGKSTLLKCGYSLLHNGFLDAEQTEMAEGIEIEFLNGYKLSWKKEKKESAEYVREEGYEYYGDLKEIDNEGKITIQKLQIRDGNNKIAIFKEWKEQIDTYLVNSFEQRILEKTSLNDKKEEKRKTYLDRLIYEQINQRNSILANFFEKPWDIPNAMKTIDKVRDIYGTLQRFYTSVTVLYNNRFLFECSNGETIDYSRLSMGEKQLLLVLLMVYNTLDKPCIFFMDEPDLGMHIDWKSIFIKTIYDINPNMQIILSTHAPSMVEGWFDHVREMEQITKGQKKNATDKQLK
ncbi:AAA family ATPase [Bacteroides fragilis]|uniref:AAA family ATPase n=1 Tax=Bacteroides fragilis TaxID=817 RepID=UPI0020307303|nr:ATP-binding protein [Bacteroides fragilis]MCE8622372.1 AAA family ATPase [Bacteroides fragilis]MCM0270413.1 AAA family ATPase [Bacteroides fragilis]